LFISELMILKSALAAGNWATAFGYLAALAIAFAAIAWGMLQMTFGRREIESKRQEPVRESFWSVAVPMVLTCGVLILGVWVPEPLWRLFISAAADLMGGGF
jgi:hydrogenase-4 component F